MKTLYRTFMTLAFLIGFSNAALAHSDPITIHKDVAYGQAAIGASSKRRLRPLLLDAYLPASANEAEKALPAIYSPLVAPIIAAGKAIINFPKMARVTHQWQITAAP